jgi:transposase
MAKRGAKNKCTTEAIERAVKLKKGGANNKDIAAALGVHQSTFYEWIANPKSDKQREFSERIKKAEADYKNALLGIILRDASQRDWHAAAWLLERKYPEEYSRTDRVKAQVEQETNATVEVVHYFDYGDGEDE